MQMWFTGEYREVVENERLVYTESMSDEHGNPSPPPGMPDMHPVTTEVRVELEAVGGRTKMVLTHVGIPAGSPGAAGWRWRSTSWMPTRNRAEPVVTGERALDATVTDRGQRLDDHGRLSEALRRRRPRRRHR